MTLLADVVWPSLFLEGRLLAWWIIAAGLLIEFGFVLWLTRASLSRASAMTLLMNMISTGIGFFGIPLSGIAWELIASISINPFFHWGTFNPVTWLVSCVLAALLNTVVETASLRLIFKISWTKRLFGCLFLANMITVGMAMTSIAIRPPRG
jgi:hypothetical protein